MTLQTGGKKLHSFSLCHGFFPLGFPGKVFNEAVPTDRILYSFSFTRFFLTSSKVLMRHIFGGHPKGSVMKYMDVHSSSTSPPLLLLFTPIVMSC